MSTVLKRGESSGSKRLSTMETKTPATSQPEPVKQSEPTQQSKVAAARARLEAMQGVTQFSKSQLLQERAQKLGERYGIDMKSFEWQHASVSADETVLRIDKPIRMRVRRTCHRCEASFNTAKECPRCQHVRCTKCPRHPAKRTEAEIIASRERRAALIKANKENAPIIPDYDYTGKDIKLTRPSKTGGQDLVYKKPRQRVRRTCHECHTLFAVGNKTCAKCNHTRCTDCPRDPPKKDKYPFGYPGDEYGPSSIPHYECEKCKKVYPTGAEHGAECKKCGTQLSEASPRAKPRKVEPEPDAEVLKRIQAKLESLKVAE
jgi:hypothetical protein